MAVKVRQEMIVKEIKVLLTPSPANTNVFITQNITQCLTSDARVLQFTALGHLHLLSILLLGLLRGRLVVVDHAARQHEVDALGTEQAGVGRGERAEACYLKSTSGV